MARDFIPGSQVSWFQRSDGKQTHAGGGTWRKAVIKRLTPRRIVIWIEDPAPDENPLRTVNIEALEFSWKRAELHAT